jgi:IclR family acetate operon transcriptional repressor
MPDGEAERAGVKSLDRAIEVLFFLAANPPDCSILTISCGLGTTPSTVHRILTTLSQRGLVEQDPITRRYGIGVQTLRLAAAYRQRVRLQTVALSSMRRLRDATGETINLHIASGSSFVCIEQVESLHQVRRVVDPGMSQPLEFRGASGKVLYSWLPFDDQQRLQRDWRAEQSLAERPWLNRDIPALAAEIRGRGFAISSEEGVPGVAAVSAPIFDVSGAVTAALTVSGPVDRLPETRMLEISAQVRDAAAEISAGLGYGLEAS